MATSSTATPRFKLVFFIPPANLPVARSAIFATGAGTIGDYTEVCFTTVGQSQFRPGPAAKPHIGQVGQLEQLEELRCEIRCHGAEQARAAVLALKANHPYEEVAYEVYRVEEF